MKSPPSPHASMSICVGIPLESLQDVVGLQTQRGRSLGCRNGTNPASTQHDKLDACRSRPLNFAIEAGADFHTGPLLPRYCHGPRDIANPLALGIGPDIDQNGLS
jgi:hypothetical protein